MLEWFEETILPVLLMCWMIAALQTLSPSDPETEEYALIMDNMGYCRVVFKINVKVPSGDLSFSPMLVVVH